jgi:TctA family transporter
VTALEGLVYGFSVALSPANLLACVAGVLTGTVVGVLPGIGPIGAMALLLPPTFALSPAAALTMFAGIYYGAMYGGSTTSILVNVPGEAASVITCLDGYQMARRGRAGAALAVSAVGSFVAGTLGVLGLVIVGGWLAEVALRFGPPEYFALTVMGLAVLSRLSGDSLARSALMLGLGLVLGTVGMEPMSGVSRFTFGSVQLAQGIELVPVAMGLFGIAEILTLAETRRALPRATSVRLRELLPTREEWHRAVPAMLRGSGLGFLVGLVPGPAAVLSTFLSYAVERRLSRTMRDFLEMARNAPGKLRVGSPGLGTILHLNLEALKREARVDLTHVPFAGGAESVPALLGGHIDGLNAHPSEILRHVQAGKARVLAVYQEQRNRLFPDAPTFRELGHDITLGVYYLLIAPRGTPAAVLQTLHDAARKALDEPVFVNMARIRGYEIEPKGPEALRQELWDSYRKNEALIKALGLGKK